MKPTKQMVLSVGLPLALLVALQLVPYGRDHTNPPARHVVAWNAEATRDLAMRACFDRHSNETRWPWYASIAPVSWRIQHNVREGREKLNFTALDPGSESASDVADEAPEMVTKGKMPPLDYLLMHPEAWMSSTDRRALATGLEATLAGFPEHARQGHDRNE